MPHDDGEPTDDAMIDAINDGDVAAFETLYRRHRDWVVRLARRFTGSDADALDVLQNTFVYLYHKFPGFTLTASLRTLLWTVVRSESLMIVRKRKRSIAIDETVLDLPAKAQATDGEVAAIVASLSVEHRQVVLMRFVDDLSTDEIAVALSIPSGTVKSRLHHALAHLRASPTARRYFDR